jgi:superfamily II DNA or RNA helicase
MSVKFHVIHKGTIVFAEELQKYVTIPEIRKVCNRLTYKHVQIIGGKKISEKQMQVYRIEKMGDKKIMTFGNGCDIVQEFYKVLCDRSVENADKFLLNAKVLDKRPKGLSVNKEKFSPGIILSPEQYEYLHEVVGIGATDEGTFITKPVNFTLVAGPGEGKSYMGLYLVSKLGGKTALILPNALQLSTWKKILEKYFPNLVVGEYHGKVKKDGDIVIILKTSALSDVFKFPEREVDWVTYSKEFRTVIYDEIHNYPTAKGQELFWRFGCRNTIGMTGTPEDRADGFDTVYVKHVGPIYEKPSNVDTGTTPWLGEVTKVEYFGDKAYTEKLLGGSGFMSAGLMAKQFAEDPYRNQLLLEQCNRLLELGKNIYIYAEHRETLINTQAFLQGHLPDMNIYILMGGVSQEDIEQAAATARIILLTYSYASEQLSIPKMDALVLLTSRKSKFKQILPRILRMGGDLNKKREIVDIVDMCTDIKKHFPKRKAVYDKYNFPVTPITISWDKYTI